MTTNYAVYYGSIISGLYTHSGALAIFCKRETAKDYAAELNALTHGYFVEEVKITKVKKSKKGK